MPVPGTAISGGEPNIARIYDHLLGGSRALEADRNIAACLIGQYPDLRDLATQNRAFALKAVTWAAGGGISQFIDCGCGLPASPSIHETARASRPGAKVAYIDRDPVVLSYARAMLGGDGTAVIAADVTGPAGILAGPGLREIIDLAGPVCVLFAATLSAMDAQQARETVAGFARELAPGSVVAISCVSYADEELAKRMTGILGQAWHNHTLADVESFFAAGGLRLACGKVADVRSWPLAPERAAGAQVLGGAGLKP